MKLGTEYPFREGSTSQEPIEYLSNDNQAFVAPTSVGHSESQENHDTRTDSESGHGAMAERVRAHAMGIMSKHLFEEGCKQRLICFKDPSEINASPQTLAGVAMRISRNAYTSYPNNQPAMESWIAALRSLHVRAAMTLRTTAVDGILGMISPDAQQVALSPSSRIQVLDRAADLSVARKAQGAAFIREAHCVIIWSDEADTLLSNAEGINQRILGFLWNAVSFSGEDPSEDTGNYFSSSISACPKSALTTALDPGESIASGQNTPSSSFSPHTPGHLPQTTSTSGFFVQERAVRRGNRSNLGHDSEKDYANEIESGATDYDERPTVMISSISHGLAASIALLLSVLQLRQALELSLLDGNWTRMAVAAAIPVIFIVCMFFSDTIIGNILMIFGPVSQLHSNTRYYSGRKPEPLHSADFGLLPRITIQMPVYKESLEGVLQPSFESIKRAIRTYELQGGSASIVVSEDGMTLVDERERQARLAYYEENNMTWIARPIHGDDGFVRSGRFKKASNLNFTYEVLERVEQRMSREYPTLAEAITGSPSTSDYGSSRTLAEEAAYRAAYNEVLQDELRLLHPRACGSGVDRIGDLILLIDSDTRIPEDCFLDAASEMTRSKDVAILQHCSGVMTVSSSYFERVIAYFTKIVNFSISYAVANGDVAPFMGHNAYLRWSALKEVAKIEMTPEGTISSYKIWSDEHVSEDFVMALDLIDRGYITRWATYADGGYEEGVSLSCTDELNRWQKYAWGVSEIVFNKFWQWPYRGPFSPLFRRFVRGPAPIHYKWASLSYCFSYYAIACALPAVLALTLVDCWLGPDVAVSILAPPFQIFIAVILIYTGVSTVAIAVVRYRAGLQSWWTAIWGQIKFIPFAVVFFGGLPYHCLTALMSHLFGLNMSWGATLKDIDMVGFYKEVPMLVRRFWRMDIICIIVVAGSAILTTDLVPLEWRLYSVYKVFPLFFIFSLHLLYPIILNPNLVRFSF